MAPGYTSPTAQRVYDKMCNYHRGIIANHRCRNPAACARAGRLAAWLEGLTEEDEEWFRQMRIYYASHGGEPWIEACLSLDFAISGVREMV